MEIINEDEKKINLIKCPLPKIIYTTLNGQIKFSKKSLNTSNNATYYSRKINNRSPGLPSLKTKNKFSSSPNKTNYINIKLNNNLRSSNNTKNNINKNVNLNKTANANKEIKKPNLKEILNNYGLNKYYDKIVELGLNDDNINNLGLMNKKTFNEFISNIKMFPGHIVKMEQLYQNLKQYNSNNRQLHNNSNIKTNINSNNHNENNSNNGVNFVTLSFNRNSNNNITSKIMHSQSQNKYRFINPTIKPKNTNIKNNNNIINGKQNNNHYKTNYSQQKTINKNKSKKKIDSNNTKNIFDLQKPISGGNGRNILIKYFFKDLSNYVNNMSGIMNNINNIQNLSIYNNNFNRTNNNALSNSNNINQEKKINVFSNTFNENHLSNSNINIKEINPSDLPSIKNSTNNNQIKINSNYNKSLVNSANINNINVNINKSPKLEQKNNQIGENANKKNKNINIMNDKLDKSKTINNYQIPNNINIFLKEEYINNMNSINNDNNKVNNKENLKNNKYENLKKNSKINNNSKLKLPNVMNKTDFRNSLSKSKIKQKSAEEKNHSIIEKDKKSEKKEDIGLDKNNFVLIKNEKTLLKKKNKNENLNGKEQKVDSNEKNKDNFVLISSIDDNKIIEEKKAIRLRDKENEREKSKKNNNIQINKRENIIEQKNTNENVQISNSKKIQSKQIIINDEINKKKNIENNTISNNPDMNKNNNLSQQIEIIPNLQKKEEKSQNNDKGYNLEDIVYENLRLNRSFSEDKSQNIYQFDLEFICRCLSLCLSILIETSKESPHITEINLEALSASNIKYFFFNEIFNENINILFDLFDKDVNKDININQISPLDKLESILSENEDINYDISCLKHIKKEKDEFLIKKEEEKEKNQDKVGREGFRGRPIIGDIEKDIKFIDEFFSLNSRKKRVINYQHVSEISKNVLCKELSCINEIDSELNGTNNSNINNTNLFNNSNNNINDSIKGKKNVKDINNSNIIDNDEMKEIKEIKEINDEDINNTFNNIMNELGNNSENNYENINKKEIKNNMSNNSITLGVDDTNLDNNTINKKDEFNQFEIGLNEDNKIITSPSNNNENRKSEKDKMNYNNNLLNNDNNINIKETSDNIIVTINSSKEDTNNTNNKKEEENKESQNADIVNAINKSNEKVIDSKSNDLKEQDEEDIYESDYVIDINSIDELTYYLIKRSEIFDEDFNYFIMKISERRYIPTPEPQTIFDFMADIIILTKMEKEVIILSLIYIERLIFNTGLLLNSRNWRRILLTAMIIASKIYDDNSFENSHFSQVFANLGVGEINTLERIFLELINYKVFIKQSEYFKYLLMVKIIALKYNYNGRQIIPVSIIKNMKYQEFTEAMQNRMRKKVTLNNSAQF